MAERITPEAAILDQARRYVDDETASDDPQSLVAGLLAVLDLASDDLAKAEDRYRISLDQRADLELDNEGLSRHTAFMERYRMRAARYGAAADQLCDALLAERPSIAENEQVGMEYQRMRRLLDNPPTPARETDGEAPCPD